MRFTHLKTSCLVIVCWIVFTALSSSVMVRSWLAAPLVVHDNNARGDACYVLAGGGALLERLDAAADLVQMGRVGTILVMQENKTSQFRFKSNSSWTRTQWISDYFAWRGIPLDRISWIPQEEWYFGTLIESLAVAKYLPNDVKSLVIVSSAPHMRRSLLSFKRSLPSQITVVPYAATEFKNSHEMYHPIWIEYCKLLIYFVVA